MVLMCFTWTDYYLVAPLFRILNRTLVILITSTSSVMLATGIIGYVGAFLHSKPLIVASTLLGLVAIVMDITVGYVAYRFVHYVHWDDMMWMEWGRYRPWERIAIEVRLGCCGYLSALDRPEVYFGGEGGGDETALPSATTAVDATISLTLSSVLSGVESTATVGLFDASLFTTTTTTVFDTVVSTNMIEPPSPPTVIEPTPPPAVTDPPPPPPPQSMVTEPPPQPPPTVIEPSFTLPFSEEPGLPSLGTGWQWDAFWGSGWRGKTRDGQRMGGDGGGARPVCRLDPGPWQPGGPAPSSPPSPSVVSGTFGAVETVTGVAVVTSVTSVGGGGGGEGVLEGIERRDGGWGRWDERVVTSAGAGGSEGEEGGGMIEGRRDGEFWMRRRQDEPFETGFPDFEPGFGDITTGLEVPVISTGAVVSPGGETVSAGTATATATVAPSLTGPPPPVLTMGPGGGLLDGGGGGGVTPVGVNDDLVGG
ncbi:hypothetical protein HDU67_003587, partial [Dinochytrium kinnereticum]